MAGLLQVPLLDNGATAKELQMFLGGDNGTSKIPNDIRERQAEAQSMVEARRALEDSVAADKPADTELLANYMAYIRVEEASCASFQHLDTSAGFFIFVLS